ncbi:YidB family protein [Acinetobacter rathckeae]|uniref:YidB family protein n=1 Tax=Acinetobacter rathckeae TaxID=2605272 RepID=UPI0018A2CE9B|nr:YidB family protein [Acinetobacter rathckeae]MBF7686986.1 DUF937 domain-containing protein [Acinetobacter rathckeae]MBF7694610.1 DUF937 domain-containing protein [Acinetobacter rathckeae]
MTDLTSIVETLAKQALGGQNNQNSSGLGGVLGSVLGSLGNNNQSSNSGMGGILGSVLGSLTGGSSQQSTENNTSATGGLNAQSLLVAVVPLILSWIQQQGGLQAALDKLRGAGLANQVQSWVSPSASSDDVAQSHVEGLFDDKDIEQVAAQTQTDKQDVYSAISTVLPQIINSLTPQGEQTSSQEANNDIQKVLGMVSGFLK